MGWTKSEKERLWKNLYYPVFQGSVIGCLGHANADIRLICDLAEEYSEGCVRLFQLLRKKRAEAKCHCFGIAFADDEVTPCLQMADMVAYCGRANETISRENDPIAVEIASMLYSSDRRKGTVRYRLSEEGLGDAELIWEGIGNAR